MVCVILAIFAHNMLCNMEWTKDALKQARSKAKLSQAALAKELGVHWRTVQNWEKGTTIPAYILPTLEKIIDSEQDYVPREEYNKVLEALESATELNRKLTGIIQSSIQSSENKD